MALKLHDERMIAVREDFDLHSEFCQRDVTDGMRVSWNFLLTWKEVNLAKVQQKAPRNVSWRYVLNEQLRWEIQCREVSEEVLVNWKLPSDDNDKCLKCRLSGQQSCLVDRQVSFRAPGLV